MWIIWQRLFYNICNRFPLLKWLCQRTCGARGRRAGPAFWCDGGTRARGDAINLVARITTVGGYRGLDGGRVAHNAVGWALKCPTICHGKNVHDGSSLLATSRTDRFTEYTNFTIYSQQLIEQCRNFQSFLKYFD